MIERLKSLSSSSDDSMDFPDSLSRQVKWLIVPIGHLS